MQGIRPATMLQIEAEGRYALKTITAIATHSQLGHYLSGDWSCVMSEIIRPLTACPSRAGRPAPAAAVLLDAAREWTAANRGDRESMVGHSAASAEALPVSPYPTSSIE